MSKIAGANARFFEDASTWPAFGNASLSGYERSRVYLNRGVAGWVDVADRVGVTDLYDGRAVALADLSNRGAVDVIVANQNQPAVLYRSRPDSANHWIAFKLVGTRSNRSAIGAEVTLESGDLSSGASSTAARASRARTTGACTSGSARASGWTASSIQWPSGTRQVLVATHDRSLRHRHRAGAMSDASRTTELARAGGERRSRDSGSARAASIRAISSRCSSRSCCWSRSCATTWSAATTRLALALGVCMATEAVLLLVRPRQGRQPAERLHQRHQPDAAHEAAGRRALAVRARRLSRDLVQVRAALSRPAPLEPDQLRDLRAAARRAEQGRGAEPPVRQRPRHQSGDLDVRADHRHARRRAAHHAHLRRELPRCSTGCAPWRSASRSSPSSRRSPGRCISCSCSS